MIDHHVLDHFAKLIKFFGGEILHEAEVKKCDSSTWVKQIIAGMGIAVKRCKSIQTAKGEAVEGFGGKVLLFLAPCQKFVPSDSIGEFCCENPSA